jgi:hypothetical protein
MSDEADPVNPYTPPAPETGERRGRRARGRRKVRGSLREALERLDEHLADPGEVERDRAAAGRRFRPLTVVCGVLFVLMMGVCALGFAEGNTRGGLLPLGVGLGIVTGILGAVSLIFDLSLVDRAGPSSPEATLKSFFRSMSLGRHGYAWAVLSPTAREQDVHAPELGAVVTGGGTFSVDDPSGLKGYIATFARPGQGQMRSMSVKRVTLGSIDGDVAEVSATLAFQSWPQWVNVVMVLSFVLFRPLVILWLILYFAVRKRHEVRVTRTLLRGRTGAWYLYQADLLEGSGEG